MKDEVAERIDRRKPPVMSQLFDVFLWRPMLHGIGAVSTSNWRHRPFSVLIVS